MKSQFNKLGASFLLVTAFSTAAQAAVMTGHINIGANGSTAVIDQALNTVDIVTSVANNSGFNARVSDSTGDLAVLAPFNTLGNYNDFQYDPLVVTNPIWTFGILTFDLTQITSILESTDGVILRGTGVIRDGVGGFDDTVGNWSFSADRSSSRVNFSWSSTATANTVPDGGTSAALLGASLLGLVGLSRKFRKA